MTLRIENLSKRYSNNVQALNNLTITIKKGMFGLLGPNGAGKSTLMRTIATLQEPDSGTIHFNDINVLENPMVLRKTLGYLPQQFGVFPKNSAQDLLEYFAVLKGIHLKSDRNRMIDYVLEVTNLTEVRYKYVHDYSGGMKQRFGIAQLLLNNPSLLIVDEPTAGLDPAERSRFLNVLRAIGKESTVIFSTHIVDDVSDLCTDLAIVNNGKIYHHDTPQNSIESLAKKVYTRYISSDDIDQFQNQYTILSDGYNEKNEHWIRVYSEVPLPAPFEQTNTNLEDVYFYHLSKSGESAHV